MHIPDNFLSTRVWLTLDGVAAPAVAWVARRAHKGLDEARIPLLGVLGAFVFAAQMVNFPVGVGTSAHLVGGALLTAILGPAPAALVMTAIIATQAFVFQDGGVLALGANVFNMALAGVLAAWVPLRLFSGRRRVSLFLAGFLSVAMSAGLALAELTISGIRMPPRLLALSAGLFAIGAIVEGMITLAAVRAIERLNPRWIGPAPANGSRAWAAIAFAAVLMVVVGRVAASGAPDGVMQIGQWADLHARPVWAAPMADYSLPAGPLWLRRPAAAMLGLGLVGGSAVAASYFLLRRRSS